MMKNKTHIVILSMTMLLCACIKDTSMLPEKQISEITVDSPSDTINVDFGYELVFEPDVSQTMDKELSYEWSYQGYTRGSIGGRVRGPLEVLSNEKTLKYSFKNLGEYILRLKVSNEHGSTFKYYTLFVNAPFNQGIFVLSANENKKGRVSFMRPLSREETEAGKEETFYTNAFTTVNPDFQLNDPTDAVKIGADIFISSKEDQLIYRIDAQTFDVYNITDFKADLPSIKPLAIVSKDRSISNYVVLSSAGTIANVNYNSDIPFRGSFFDHEPIIDKLYSKETGAPKPPSTSVTRMRSNQFFLNYSTSTLYYIYEMANYYSFEKSFPEQDLINIVMDENTMSCLIGQSKSNLNEIIITRGYANNAGPFGSLWEFSYLADDVTLTRESYMQSNNVYNSIFYTNKNRLYRWYNWTAEPMLPKTPVVTLDEGKEITCFGFSQDYKEIYLGVYDANSSGLKGSVYVYDADEQSASTGQLKLIKKFEGVADKPIKIFWKNNRK